ncbi:NACHT domain-containing protein [Tardiphaga sp. 11_C7_N12_6]|uniref:NACHT domain-containing protein n=1 Tax=Tardiphaga sp. 11_C7_N12_6 TaxID=3240789 RepID=UPI003F280027
MPKFDEEIDKVRASRAGHTFHERWAARRALQLVFPNDDLFAIAVEGISATETARLSDSAEEVADLVLYYGKGDNFQTCKRLETFQFKYKIRKTEVTAAYLKKTIKKFSETILGYEKASSGAEIDEKVSFVFVTNSEFSESLWSAIQALIDGTTPSGAGAANQARNLRTWCNESGLADASRLFSRLVFRAGEKSLAAQDNALKRTLTDWSAGTDSEARLRLHGLQDLILKKAGPSGQGKNLVHREDVLDALDCYPDDLFPADTQFIDVGAVVERAATSTVLDLIKGTDLPILVHAEGGVGKTVFVQSLAASAAGGFEVVVFDCFGGGSYRSENYSRHLPKVGLVQIVNELSSRTLCDPLLPSGDDSRKVIKATRKRLAQATEAVRSQSQKHGLLLIVDAADNAQLEAEYRHEEAFPKLLLSSISEDPIEGVKLLLTARTHRKDGVIGRAKVKEVELGPFTDREAREFLKERRPAASNVEITTALVRSGRNARVLDYLVQTWDINIARETSTTPITVPEIIAQRCTKIVGDLHVTGWSEAEISEFFVALSLLPPPIPLEELARALGWSAAQVKTAASDLAPMLEIASHGAIFRDEPTETYVREEYSARSDAQKAIADRLLSSQAHSSYAAEALPHFLVVIKDSDRAFALADSTSFPTAVQSDFGRRRLTLARLRAAFRLAVADVDFDRVLGLSMRLAHAATASMRGDEFIRSSPALAVLLGDADSYRRLASDRSGWRGARSTRLTVAHRFAGDIEEAQIQCGSAIRWLNWYNARSHDGGATDRSGPEVDDFAALLFHHVADGAFDVVDRNLGRWNDAFSLSVSEELLKLVELFDQTTSPGVLASFIDFVASDLCKSQTLKLRALLRHRGLAAQQLKVLTKTKSAPTREEENERYSSEPKPGSDSISQAALAMLFHNSRAKAATLIRRASLDRPSAFDYGEHYGFSRAWPPILRGCIRAWAAGRPVAYYDLLPNSVKINKAARAVVTRTELSRFLGELRASAPTRAEKKGEKQSRKNKRKLRDEKFNSREREDIVKGIEIARALTKSIENAALLGRSPSKANVSDFLDVWSRHQRDGEHWGRENASDLLARTVGIGCVRILLTYAPEISVDQANVLLSLISSQRVSVQQKIDVLAQMARRPPLHELVGEFARHVADHIRQDENIGTRGTLYVRLAASLVPMSLNEAREYYRQGLAQLDQMGGESYDQIYSLLNFAAAQGGGFIRPALSQRLMNLCQTIVQNEPSKFAWTLFARAAAKSIGYPAMAKLVRWHDQDVADLSYGLPQLGCFLAKDGHLDPRRAAFLLTICRDRGWWDWHSGDAVSDLLELSNTEDQRRIFLAIITKLRAEHPFDAWPSLWEGYLRTNDKYTNLITAEERAAIQQLKDGAKRKQDEFNSRNDPTPGFVGKRISTSSAEDIESQIGRLIKACNPSSAGAIDEALRSIEANDRLPYDARQRLIDGMRIACPYPQRIDFMFAVCGAASINLSQSVEVLIECLAIWEKSSAHLRSSVTDMVKRLFECKGGELFETQFSSIARNIHQLSEFCGDKRLVLQLVLGKVAADEVDLGGDEWLQLATALCDVTSGQAGLVALELFLGGPASRIADEIGEGPFLSAQQIVEDKVDFIADVAWHLLGNEDAYVRWTVARGIQTLVELGLADDLSRLLDRFDQREVESLVSTDRKLAFQNSRQWLLLGLSRAASRQGKVLCNLREKLTVLAQRDDLHLMHKVHILRCLDYMGAGANLEKVRSEIDRPMHGVVTNDGYPGVVKSASGFRFDHEFRETEIKTLARLFNVAEATVEDAMAEEIRRLWPDATSMDYFAGRERYRWDRGDRYEFYREHVQRHALLGAATFLSKRRPIVVKSYEIDDGSTWLEWRNRYDVTFDDGSWLSDQKDRVPSQAKENLLIRTKARQVALPNRQAVLLKLGMETNAPNALTPLYGRWSSPDDVTINIRTALTEKKGAVARCASFANEPSHAFWLPEFWDDGYYDLRHRSRSAFKPLVWAPENHSLGIDEGDEIAAQGPAGRPRLGIDLTRSFGLVSKIDSGEWFTADGKMALRSQVWGNWKSDPGPGRSRHHNDGEILWASQEWLSTALKALDMRLVFTMSLWKYRSARSYETSEEIKSVLLGLMLDDGAIRLWHANGAVAEDY